MLVSLITVNYNQTAVTCALLDSVRRQSYKEVEVIVVDNGSADDAGTIICPRYPEVHFIASPFNLGFAGGNNLGIAAAKGHYLFFINNDAELTEGCIQTLIERCVAVPDVGAVSPLICYFPEADQAVDIVQYAGMTPVHPLTARNQMLGNGMPDEGQYQTAAPVAYAHGAALFMPRSTLERVGPMPDDFFLYYEELDWCAQMHRAGLSIWFEPKAKVYHKESLSVSSMGPLKTYFLNRNRILFMRRNTSSGALWPFYLFLWLVTVPKNLLVFALKREWANLCAFWQAVCWNFGGRGDARFEDLLLKG
jgi:GT2 family glycosyltransferase